MHLNVCVMKTYEERPYCIELLHKEDQDKDPPVNVTVIIVIG